MIFNGGSTSIKESLESVIARMSASPPVQLPVMGASKEYRELRDLIMSQQKAQVAIPPMVLPPPKVKPPTAAVSAADSIPPPPPPPPVPAHVDIHAAIASMLPAPARIPAPPIFNITSAMPSVTIINNNVLPAPESTVVAPVEDVKCSREDGSPLPRCKREPPTIKCKRKSEAQVVGGGNLDGDDDDNDGDCDTPDLPTKGAEEPPCVNCDKPGSMHHDDFNPKRLLQRLCAGGNCPRFEDSHEIALGNTVHALPARGSGFLEPSTGSL